MKLHYAILAAAAAIAAAGCGEDCPTETPQVDHIGSCTASPSAAVSYPVQTCEGAGITCDVDLSGVGSGSGTIFLDPRAAVCGGGSTSCPASCSPSQSICSFAAPASPGNYTVSAYDPCTNQTKSGMLTVAATEIPGCTL
jgi:hypothetical protein